MTDGAEGYPVVRMTELLSLMSTLEKNTFHKVSGAHIFPLDVGAGETQDVNIPPSSPGQKIFSSFPPERNFSKGGNFEAPT